MSDIPALSFGLLGGALLGTMFFGGLWWTVQKAVRSDNPAIWFFGSLLLRTGLVLAGFYFGSRGHWSTLAAYLFGFIIARIIVVKWLATKSVQPMTSMAQETHIAT